MELEQKPPNKPNFLLVVLLFAGAIVVILLVGAAIVRLSGGHFPSGIQRHPSTRLLLPGAPASTRLA